MLRRDYILRMIEEFIQMLARLNALKRGQLWNEAAGTVDEEFQRLIGAGAETVARLSETELMARIIQSGPTQAVRDKTLLLSTLLKEAGEVAAAQNRTGDSRLCYLKGLHLLLDTLAGEDVFQCPDFVPRVENFVAALRDAPLPLPTQARLMQHYERVGDFGKAEDCLFALLEGEPKNPGLLEFGSGFYRRLAGLSDARLAEGNLPRPELEAGLAELRARVAPHA
jgi:hypothetical protein